MKRLAVICARAGSKGIRNKNLRLLSGKPLISHTLLQAKACGLFEWIAVSSDSPEILQIGSQWGADFVIERPLALADDTAAKVPAIRHCTAEVEKRTSIQADIIVDLDATAPLRELSDIQSCIDTLENSHAENLVSAAPARRSPYFNLVELDEQHRVHLSKSLPSTIVRRQDSPKCFDLNASIYVWRRAALFSENNSALGKNTILYEMPEDRSIDIDNETDFAFVEFMMAKKLKLT